VDSMLEPDGDGVRQFARLLPATEGTRCVRACEGKYRSEDTVIDHLTDLFRAATGGVQRADETAHGRAGDLVHRDVMFLKPLQHTYLGKAQRAAATQGKTDARPGGNPRRRRGGIERRQRGRLASGRLMGLRTRNRRGHGGGGRGRGRLYAGSLRRAWRDEAEAGNQAQDGRRSKKIHLPHLDADSCPAGETSFGVSARDEIKTGKPSTMG
jgi:hypothetical protein